ncbi:MAG: EamA family transporter, partial [Candidatus Brockarchaeota archaeon]|nr:EamA family transporter [Candidatus Brockarchaeota archaeon]
MALGKTRSIGFLEIAGASMIWGSNGVIVNFVPLPSYIIAFFRVFIATIAITLGIVIAGKRSFLKTSYPLKKLLTLGLILCLGWGLLFEAMKRLPIAEAVLLNYTAPIFVALLSPGLLKEETSKRTAVALGLSFTGIILILLSPVKLQLNSNHLWGIIIGISAGLSYALFIIYSKKTVAYINHYTLALYANLFASLILAPGLITFAYTIFPQTQMWLLLLTLGVVNTAFALTLYYSGLRKVRAQEAAVLTYLEPVSAAFYGCLFLGQLLTALA